MQRDQHDLWGGLVLAAVGLAVALHAMVAFDLGTLRAMGPGFFPAALGGLLTVLGMMIAIPAWTRAGEARPFNAPEALAVLAAVILFGAGLSRLGLIPTTALAVLLASWPAPASGILWRLGLAGAITVLTWLVFSAGLQMPIPLWPAGLR